MRYNADGLFPVLEAALKAASEPLTSQDLFDMAEVKQNAASVNRVSDYLGNMWRKGVVLRTAAAKTGESRARWAYSWKGSKGPKLYNAVEYTPKILADRPAMLISEEGNVVTLEFPNLVIQIRQKPGQ